MKRIPYKAVGFFFLGAFISACIFAVLLELVRPRSLGLAAETLEVEFATLSGQQFVVVNGPGYNPLGAQQYVAFRARNDTITIGYFVTTFTLPRYAGFRTEWPLLIPQAYFGNESVRLKCVNRTGEELVATILRVGDQLTIQREAKSDR